jgi:hypothetical protein
VRTVLIVVAVVVLAGCGGSSSPRTGATTPARTAPADPNADLRLPAHVPRRARGRADPVAVRVIARWLRALRSGDERRAARFWADGSKFQNATPVLTIDSAIEKLAIQKSLPCGAKIRKAGGPAPFVVLVFTLTNRPGGLCGSAAGHSARGAIRISHGRIAEWYRLPDDPAQPEPDSAITEGSAAA